MAREKQADDPVARRTYLKLAGIGIFSTATAHVGSDNAVAANIVGYGEGEYGTTEFGGSTQSSSTPEVSVNDAANITQTQATLRGTVSDLGGTSSVTVRFGYRPLGASSWTSTSEQSLSETGTFDRQITDLTPATDYEFRVEAAASNGETATSDTATFTTKQHILVIDGAPSPNTLNAYSFTVSDSVEKSSTLGSIQSNDTISGTSVSGEVLGGKDAYRFTGDVTVFDVDGRSDVYLDGEQVDPVDLGDTTYPNTLVIDGSPAPRRQATYDATVTGKIKKNSVLGSIQSNDTISGSTATGQVYGGKDGYRFTGGLSELRVDGDQTVSLTYSDESSASSDSLVNSFVVDGTGTPNQVATYSITVSGDVEKSSELGSINKYDTISGDTASGRIVGGKDGYRYSGDVTRIKITGPAAIRFDNQER